MDRGLKVIIVILMILFFDKERHKLTAPQVDMGRLHNSSQICREKRSETSSLDEPLNSKQNLKNCSSINHIG